MKTRSPWNARFRQAGLGLGVWLLVGSWPMMRWVFDLPPDAYAIWESAAIAAAILWAGRSAASVTTGHSQGS